MKELSGDAVADVGVPIRDAYALVRDLERYPSWAGELVREVEVTERDADGEAGRVRARLRAKLGPIDREFEVGLGVRSRVPEEVVLERLPHELGDRETLSLRWTLAPAPGGRAGTRLSLALAARLDIPRLLPIPGGAGDEVARRFMDAAAGALGGG